MDSEQIQTFLDTKLQKQEIMVKVYFKKRDAIKGVFVRDRDFAHLKSKNFWRIVSPIHLDEYKRSGNINLARIFNGSDFSRITLS